MTRKNNPFTPSEIDAAVVSVSDEVMMLREERDKLRDKVAEQAGIIETLNDAVHGGNVKIARLESAVFRQVENIEHWLWTDVSAGPEESKSIYEQLCSSIGRTHV